MVVVLLVDCVEELDQVLQPLVVRVVHVEAAVAAAHAVVEGEPARISRLCLLENYADLEKNIFFGNSEILGIHIWRGKTRKF